MNAINRREFLAHSVVAGVSVYVAAPGSSALAALFEGERLRPSSWDAATGKLRYRTDATAKVTGEKIFSIDMRSRDLPGWPQAQSHAMLLRVTRADRAYAGFDLSVLGDELRPDRDRHGGGPCARRRGLSAVLRRGHAPARGTNARIPRSRRGRPDLARLRALPGREDAAQVSRRLDPLGRATRVRSNVDPGRASVTCASAGRRPSTTMPIRA